MKSNRTRPNVLLVVMDCVRASDFQPDPTTGYLPFAAELARESVQYTRAVSPSSWTLPSHASLFTGLYPWEHGAHGVGKLRLSQDTPTLPEMLRPLGYGSASLSSNFLVSPQFGLAKDFDMAYWGGWWEPYLRNSSGIMLPDEASGASRGLIGTLIDSATNSSWHGPSPILQTFSPFILKRTYILDIAHRIGIKVHGEKRVGVTSPWIEPTLDRWLQVQPADKPVFCMVNLLDAHEPYFSSEELVHGLREWVRYARLSQERRGWISGHWVATPEKLRILHELYRYALGDIDRRLRRIVESFRRVGRWENTLAIITSDHGQAFGEHGKLFHIFGVTEEGVRIPFWVRYPHAEGGGSQVSSWASLVDVVPTILASTDIPNPQVGSGRPLQSLVDKPRPDPVITISDSYGYVASFSPNLVRDSRPKPLEVAAYLDDWKVVVNARSSETPLAYKIISDPMEEKNLWERDNAQLKTLARAAANAASRMSEPNPVGPSAELLQRLRAWGYVE